MHCVYYSTMHYGDGLDIVRSTHLLPVSFSAVRWPRFADLCVPGPLTPSPWVLMKVTCGRRTGTAGWRRHGRFRTSCPPTPPPLRPPTLTLRLWSPTPARARAGRCQSLLSGTVTVAVGGSHCSVALDVSHCSLTECVSHCSMAQWH